MTIKKTFHGIITSVQPRIRLLRSFSEISHTYLGYAIALKYKNTNQEGNITIGIGKAAYAKWKYQVGDTISGECLPVEHIVLEPVEYYKVSKLKLIKRGALNEQEYPPWLTVAPGLETYRKRGHRRLYVKVYESKCRSCVWGCRMPVEMIIDHWAQPQKIKYRFETFCYGPLICHFYKAGPKRRVSGRKGMVWVEEDWIDLQNTSHREPDE